jgi:hypothetical protein
MTRPRSRSFVVGALVTALAVLGASCGGDDAGGEGATTTREPATTTTTAPVVAPLTGLVDPTGVTLTRPAMTVKMDNTRRALPQFGLEQADVVYEEVVEGGITRLALMFQTHAPDKIGPIRSVRNTDQAIVWPVGGIFVYSGGAPVSVRSISEAPVDLVDERAAGDAMFRDPSRRAPFNLYGVGERLFATGGEPVPPPPLFTYRAPAAGALGDPASSVNVGFRSDHAVTWTWNPAAGSYTRHVFGADQVSGAGAPVAPQNVVVQFVNYVGGEGRGGAGAEGSEAEMIGSGEAWVFTGGVVVKGRWERGAKEQPTRFLDAAGSPIPLAPGQTWVELPQIGYAVTITS